MYIEKDNKNALKLANNKKTSSEELNQLLIEFHGDLAIAEAIAKNPNCDRTLLGNFISYDFEPARENPNYPELLKDKSWAREFIERIEQSSYKQMLTVRSYDYRGWHSIKELGIDKKKPQIFKILGCIKHLASKEVNRALELPLIPNWLIEEMAVSKVAKYRSQIAKRKTLPEGILTSLAKDKLKSVRIEVAKNKMTPPDVLALLVKDEVEAIGNEAEKNPSCPRIVFQEKRKAKKVKKSLTSAELLALSQKDKINLLTDGNLSSDVLEKLKADTSAIIRYMVGAHAQASAKICNKMLSDKVDWVRESVAYNTATDKKILAKLLKKNDAQLNSALACNASLEESMQLALLKNLTKPLDILHLAETTHSTSVLNAIVESDSKKRGNDHYITKLEQALSKNITGKKLKNMLRLIACRYRWASRLLIMRDDCPEDMLEYFNYYCPEEFQFGSAISLRLLENPGSLKAYGYKDWKIKQWLSDKTAPSYVCHYYLRSDQLKEKRQAAAGYYTCIFEFQYLVFEADNLVRKKLASRDDLPNFMWHALAEDANDSVRKELLKNRSCPSQIVKALSSSENTAVSMQARSAAKSRRMKIDKSTDDLEIKKLRKPERLKLAKTTKVLAKQLFLAQDRLSDVKTTLLQNSYLHSTILSKLLEDEDTQVRTAIAKNGKYGKPNFELLSVDSASEVRTALAANSQVEFSELVNLLEDASGDVRLAVANRILNKYFRERNKITQNWYEDYLTQMPSDPDSRVRHLLAKQYEVEERFQINLVNDEDKEIRKYLAENSKHKGIVFKLLDDSDAIVREGATNNYVWAGEKDGKNYFDRDFLLAISTSKDPAKRRRYAEHGNDAKVLSKLIYDEDTSTRKKLLDNDLFSTYELHEEFMRAEKDDALLSYLAYKTQHVDIFLSIVNMLPDKLKSNFQTAVFGTHAAFDNAHIFTHKKVQRALYNHKKTEYRRKIARQKNLELELALELCQDEAFSVTIELALFTPHVEAIRVLAEHENPRMQIALTENPYLPEDLQKAFFENHKVKGMYIKLARHTNVPEIYLELINSHYSVVEYDWTDNKTMLSNEFVLDKLARHKSSGIRYTAARQPALSDELNKMLLKDKTKMVQEAIRYKLDIRK